MWWTQIPIFSTWELGESAGRFYSVLVAIHKWSAKYTHSILRNFTYWLQIYYLKLKRFIDCNLISPWPNAVRKVYFNYYHSTFVETTQADLRNIKFLSKMPRLLYIGTEPYKGLPFQVVRFVTLFLWQLSHFYGEWWLLHDLKIAYVYFLLQYKGVGFHPFF